MFLEEHPRTVMREITIDMKSRIVGKRIVDLNFPKTAIIAMIQRGEKYITPSGTTEIVPGDILIVLSDSYNGIQEVYNILEITPKPQSN
ncbi:TrkA C-terminal domain-containing protein [Pleomorphovibrio marinus]|uniref:TrkA C-terminal domain-containing protein n=1 Tax=Pleomorphovibrio marinus TaxID=2164132 RepID=UPI001E3027C5|nr:TrkA C-terminal domain-containing protein [Pleomorphovibrio marinus]